MSRFSRLSALLVLVTTSAAFAAPPAAADDVPTPSPSPSGSPSASPSPAPDLGAACRALPIDGHRGSIGAFTGKPGLPFTVEDTSWSELRHFAYGGDRAESDLRTSRNGTWYMLHDARLGRTTNGRGLLARRTDRQLRRIRVDDGTRFLPLDKIITVMRDYRGGALWTNAKFEWEVKGLHRARAIVRLVRLANSRGLHGRVRWTSADAGTLAQLHAADPTAPRGLVVFPPTRPDLTLLGDVKAVNIPISMIDQDYVDQARELGITVVAREADNDGWWQLALSLSVPELMVGNAAATTDGDVVAYQAWCAAMSIGERRSSSDSAGLCAKSNRSVKVVYSGYVRFETASSAASHRRDTPSADW